MTDTNWPDLREADFILKDFRFASGEVLPELRQHYLTLGTPQSDAAGRVMNAVLLIHNTTGTAKTWLEPALAGELFGPGQPLDAARHFLIVPDIIGFGRSSKPSDGLRARFPHYRLHDVAVAQHRLVTEGLEHPASEAGDGPVARRHADCWMFGEMFPDFMDALVPVASQPGPMSGRNWIQRKINVEAIRNDPEWNNGDYDKQPSNWVRVAPLTALMTQSVVRIQELAPTREKGDALYRQFVERAKKADANNRLYQIEFHDGLRSVRGSGEDQGAALRHQLRRRRGQSARARRAGGRCRAHSRRAQRRGAGRAAERRGTTPRCARRCGRAIWRRFLPG